MKQILLLSFFPLFLFAAENPIYVAPPSTTPIPSVSTPAQKEKRNTPPKPTLPQAPALPTIAATSASSAPKGGPSEVMIINPEMRAKDLESALQFLRQNSPTSKPTVKLTDGTTISGIVNVDVMPGGTILIFRLSTLKGAEYKVVKIETIDSLSNE